VRKLKQKIILLCVLVLGIISFFILKPSNKVIKNNPSPSEETSGMISVLVDGVEQSAFPSKGSAEYQSTSCTNGETAVWDATNWKLSIQDISASTRCVVSFVTGGHNVYVSVSGGTVDSAPSTASVTLTGSGGCTASLSGTFYQGYSTSSCDAIKKTLSSALTQANTNSTPTKAYTKYTLAAHNSSEMGYRPVIVVYKAN